VSAWRHKAIELLPEYRQLIERAESPMGLWIDLRIEFESTVDRSEAKLLSRFLAYASWCISSASGRLPNDTSTAAIVAFYEHLPQRRAHWKLISSWLSPREFADLLPVFSYHLSPTQLEELKEEYENNRRRRQPVA
jgi:hypothetical protein